MFTNVCGLILNFTIQKLFEPKNLAKDFPFNTVIRSRGKFKVIELHKDSIVLTINKSHKEELPSSAKYKENYAKGNFDLKPAFQLRYSYSAESPKIIDSRYYGIITYSLKKSKYEFIDIVIPDSDYKEIIGTLELLPMMEIIPNKIVYADSNDDGILLTSESIKTRIKDEIKEDIKHQGLKLL